MILVDGGVTNPIPMNRVVRNEGDILIGIDVSGHDYKKQWEIQHKLAEKRKHSKSLSQQILNKLIPNNLEFNYYTMLSRVSSLMVRQNSILMTQLMKPDVHVDIRMSSYGVFDYDKSEKLIEIGRHKTQQALRKYQEAKIAQKDNC
jgi:NTE family protein